jgi:hypothetical protein
MVEPLLQAARCLAYLEIDMPRTRDLFDELARLGELAEASHQYHWGRGLVLAWSGNADQAHHALEQGIQFADAHKQRELQNRPARPLTRQHPTVERVPEASPDTSRMHDCSVHVGFGTVRRSTYIADVSIRLEWQLSPP